MWKLNNSIIIVDFIYTASIKHTINWSSLALVKMLKKFNLPPKIDNSTLLITVLEATDITKIVKYNTKDTDLHV